MYRYQAYGLTIESERPLESFPEAVDGEASSVLLKWGSIPEDVAGQHEDHVIGYAEGLFRFAAEGGHTVTIEPAKGADEGFLRTVVSGELMALVLRQRGFLVLHASCVCKNEEAIGFLGNTGWGKSTLATSFLEQGFSLVCDDVLVVNVNADPIQVIPASPHMRLLQDVGELYCRDFDSLSFVHEKTAKRLLFREDAFQRSPVYLKRLYVLEPAYRESDRITLLSPAHASYELLQHSRAMRLIAGSTLLPVHIRQCTRLAGAVPVARLERRSSLAGLAGLREIIEADRTGGVAEVAH